MKNTSKKILRYCQLYESNDKTYCIKNNLKGSSKTGTGFNGDSLMTLFNHVQYNGDTTDLFSLVVHFKSSPNFIAYTCENKKLSQMCVYVLF